LAPVAQILPRAEGAPLAGQHHHARMPAGQMRHRMSDLGPHLGVERVHHVGRRIVIVPTPLSSVTIVS
jgi:hypothetical protein